MKHDSGISLKQLRYFIAVARAGSFTVAARSLHVSQPALGLQVSQLERRLGARLLVRNQRGVELTPAGEMFSERSLEVLDALHRAELSVAQLVRSDAPELVVGVTPTIGRAIVEDLLQGSQAGPAPFKLLLREGLSDELLHLIRGSEAQAVFCYDPPDDDTVQIKPLFRENLVLVGRPDMVDRCRGAVHLRDLPRYPLALGSRHHASRQFIERITAAHGVSPDVRVEIAPISLKREMLNRQSLCTIVPYGLFLPDIRAHQLGAALIDPPMTRTMTLVTDRDVPEDIRNRLVEIAGGGIQERIAEGELRWRSL